MNGTWLGLRTRRWAVTTSQQIHVQYQSETRFSTVTEQSSSKHLWIEKWPSSSFLPDHSFFLASINWSICTIYIMSTYAHCVCRSTLHYCIFMFFITSSQLVGMLLYRLLLNWCSNKQTSSVPHSGAIQTTWLTWAQASLKTTLDLIIHTN